MREFFRGWRRKAGVVTLVMAALLMGGWLRSVNPTSEPFQYYLRMDLSKDGIGVGVNLYGELAKWHAAWRIPYPFLAIPLALTSVMLFTNKPRPPKPKSP